MSYKPYFVCPHCENAIEAQVSAEKTFGGLQQASLPLCGCPESMEALEREHRARMEARKAAKRAVNKPRRRRRKKDK